MLFNSFEFLLFLPAVFIVYYLVPQKYRWLFTFLVSAFFIAYAKIDCLISVLAIIVVNYFTGLYIEKYQGRKRVMKWILALSLVADIGALSYFKYLNFLFDNFSGLAGLFGIRLDIPHLDILLPLGISFYTFQAIGYNLDIYRGMMKAEKQFHIFATYLIFFPKLIAGPIERAQNFIPQLYKKITFEPANINAGIKLMIWGFFKKLVIADRIAIYVDSVYGNLEYHSGLTVLVAAILFAFQIYADFSGYTDIALGAARILGFRLMQNFERPFMATSVPDFWRRWHISLSGWADDYIYKPFVASYRYWGYWGVVLGLLLTFFVIGIWHGPSWNFVLFGLLQAAMIFYDLLTKKLRKRFRKSLKNRFETLVYNNISRLLTFGFITFSMIFFKATTFEHALMAIKKIITIEPGALFYGTKSTFVFAIFGIVFLWMAELRKEYGLFRFSILDNRYLAVRLVKFAVLIVIIMLTGVFDGGQFIYFQF